MHRDNGAGLEFEFGGADAVFDEEDLFGAVGEDFEAAVLIFIGVPFSSGLAKRFVLKDFRGDVAEGLGADVADEVGEGRGDETDIAVGKFGGGWRLAFYVVLDLGSADADGDVVVAVRVRQSFGVGIDFDVEDADGFVFEDEMMVRLGGDLDFRSGGLGREEGGGEDEEYRGFHAANCSRAKARGAGAKALSTA